MSKKQVDRGLRRDRSPLEVSILAVSFVAIGAVVVAILVGGSNIGNGPPDIRVTVTRSSDQASGGAPYEVVIRNVGGETAESIEIEVSVGGEKRTVSLLAVARGDEERATVVFPAGTTGDATAEVQSYAEPAR